MLNGLRIDISNCMIKCENVYEWSVDGCDTVRIDSILAGPGEGDDKSVILLPIARPVILDHSKSSIPQDCKIW